MRFKNTKNVLNLFSNTFCKHARYFNKDLESISEAYLEYPRISNIHDGVFCAKS